MISIRKKDKHMQQAELYIISKNMYTKKDIVQEKVRNANVIESNRGLMDTDEEEASLEAKRI